MIVFDLDATLTNNDHRLYLLEEKRYREYHLECVRDLPIRPMLSVLKALLHAQREVEVWSGRSEEVRVETDSWFLRYARWAYDGEERPKFRMRMRPDGDHRKNAELKEQWLHEALQLGNIIQLAFDDHPDTVDMFRRRGVTVARIYK